MTGRHRQVMPPMSPETLALQQFLELPEVGGHGLSDTWHGDAPKQAARTAELDLHRVGNPGSLCGGVQGIEQAGREGPELASYLQPAGRAIGSDLQAFFASTRNRADLLVGGPRAYRPLRDFAGLDDRVIPLGDVLKVGKERKHVLNGSRNQHRVLEGRHEPLLSDDAERLPALSLRAEPSRPRTQDRYGASPWKGRSISKGSPQPHEAAAVSDPWTNCLV